MITKVCKTCKQEKPIEAFQEYKKANKMPSGMQYLDNIIGKEISRATNY
jgi:hypothetical protein